MPNQEINTNTFCIMPWIHSCVRTNGDITLCCNSSEKSEHNFKTSSIAEWWKSDFVESVRADFMSGREPASCNGCFSRERQGIPSIRQITNSHYKVSEKYAAKYVKSLGYPKELPVNYEFQLTNLCNLKCLMCDEMSSTSIATENKILNISKINQSDYAVTPDEVSKLRDILLAKPKVLNFRGGEPMMIPYIKEMLRWAVDQGLLDQTLVHITTNGTKMNSEWAQLISRIPSVRVMLSIDAVGELYEYIRFGAKWSEVEAAARTLSQMPNVNLVIHAVLQNLNALAFTKLVDWCKDNRYYFQHGVVMTPDIFNPGNLPSELLTKVSEEFSVTPIDDQALWEKFKQEINIRDKHRNVSILDVIPELRPYWNS